MNEAYLVVKVRLIECCSGLIFRSCSVSTRRSHLTKHMLSCHSSASVSVVGVACRRRNLSERCFSEMDTTSDGYVYSKSLVYSGTETPDKPFTRQGVISKGEEMYRVYVESPARWGYAICKESEKVRNKWRQIKAKCKEMRAKCKQIKVKCEEIKGKYCQICAKYERVFGKRNQCSEWSSPENRKHTESESRFTDWETFLNTPRDNAGGKMKHRIWRSRYVSRCILHSRKKREREPSRIPYKRVIKLFGKTRKIRDAVKLYFKKRIPSSSKLKQALVGYNRYRLSDRLARSKSVLSKRYIFRQNFYLSTVHVRTSKHKKSPLLCMFVDAKMLKLLNHRVVQSYPVSCRVISLSGDVEENPGPSSAYSVAVGNTVSLLETRLSRFGRSALDVGGGGDCFFRAVSHQLYGNPHYHLHVRNFGVQYLVQNPEQFIESNTEYSWQGYLSNMSCQGTWADGIIIQAVANCFNLSIYIAESSETFNPVTVIQATNVTRECRNIYIGHIGETHYVSTVENRRCDLNKNWSGENLVEKKVIDKNEKHRAYMKEYMKKRRADAEFRKKESQRVLQKRRDNSEIAREKKTEAEKKSTVANLQVQYKREIAKESKRKRKEQNPEHVREIDKESKRKRKRENAEHVREIDKESQRKRKRENPEHVREIDKESKRKRKRENAEHVREIDKESQRKRKRENPEHVREIDKESKRKRKRENAEHVREIDKESKRKRKEQNPEHVREIAKRSFRKRKAEINRKDILIRVARREIVDDFNITPVAAEMELENVEHQLVTATSSGKLQGQQNKDNVIVMINLFHNNIKRGPEYICTCCDQLWYKSSVVKCDSSKYKGCSQNVVECCLTGLRSVDDVEWICRTCDSNLKKGILPSCSKGNKMTFPDKPELLNLTPLEERLISPRIPFMQIRELPRGGQLSIHGNVVNVPSDVNSTVHSLPRLMNESQTIPIKLKRRLSYKHHYQFQNVRPKKVLDAAKYLVETSDLFKSEGIQVENSWLDNISLQCMNEDWSEFVQNPGVLRSDLQIDDIVMKENFTQSSCENNICSGNVVNAGSETDDSDEWCEVDERPSGVTDTLLQEPDVVVNADRIISFAPGEGNKPLGIFIDKDSEYLSFPTIFCGKRRADNKERKVPVLYSTVCKWELRCQDRRVAMSVPNIFYKLKKLQIKRIQDSACISLRKCKTKGKKYTAGDLKSENYLNKLVHLDEGFRVLKNLRGSPPYFEKCKRDLFAMIRQLGKPTWFCSFSAAETRWTHLLKTLGKIVEKKEYSDDEIKQMTWEEKSNLIQKDPVTCARNFDHMVQLFFRDILKSSVMPIGEIADYFYRVEFQQRGSPHIHGLFWVKEAPEYGKSSNEEIAKFVDKYITCQKPENSSEMEDLVNLQTHRHAKTCKKGEHKVCRFNFPLPPVPRTMILTPLENSCFDEEMRDKIKENADKIKEVLDSMKYGENITFGDFLKKLQLTEESYILAVRHTLKRDTLFLKRAPSEIRINSYNTDLLKAWQANMDIQYVLDPYACATYILSYITKGQQGMSRLLEKACEEAKSGNNDIASRVRHIGNKFLNAVEISAQEAVYLVLQMPMRRSTREFQFISTSPPDERAFLLKKTGSA